MTAPLLYAGKFPTLCGCCRRRASWLGYSPSDKHNILWLCADRSCIQGAKKVYRMKASEIDHHEGAAISVGLDAAGEYAASIGKLDISTMTEMEMCEFGRRFYLTLCTSLRASLTAINK